MVNLVSKYDIHPDKAEAYKAWVKAAISRLIAVPGVKELRGYRPITGASQVVATFEFDDLTSWTAWYTSEDVQEVMSERWGYEINIYDELWGPSPVAPEPIRPAG
jgi:antibiotic biosynthesis monooxygenase (ABM) superfamily enzyme